MTCSTCDGIERGALQELDGDRPRQLEHVELREVGAGSGKRSPKASHNGRAATLLGSHLMPLLRAKSNERLVEFLSVALGRLTLQRLVCCPGYAGGGSQRRALAKSMALLSASPKRHSVVPVALMTAAIEPSSTFASSRSLV